MLNGSFFKQWWRLGGACGLAFIILFIVGILVQGETPTYGDAVDDVRAYWVDDGGTYLIGDFIVGLGFILFFFPFASALRSLLGLAEGGVQMFSRISFAGAVLFLALAGAEGAAWTSLAVGDFAENASDDTINLLMSLDMAGSHFLPAALAIMALPAGLVIVQTRVLPVWLGALTLLYSVLAIISSLSVLADNPEDSPVGWIGFIGGAIWILITSIVMLLKKDEPVASTAMLSSSTAPSAAAT
jgi:hypothetical protein